MRTIPKVLFLLAALGSPLAGVAAAALPETPPPNVLIVVLDDFGVGQFAPVAKEVELGQIAPDFLAYTLGLGDDKSYDPKAALAAARTAMPFIDSLADQGVRFDRAYSANCLCSPARASLLSGMSSTRWGGYRNIDINVTGIPEGRSLVEQFQSAGYRTAMIGKWHMGGRDEGLSERIKAAGGGEKEVEAAGYLGSANATSHPLNHGFDYAFFYNRWECPYYDSQLLWENHTYTGRQTQYNTDLFTQKAMDFMEAAHKEGKSFFVELALHTIHMPQDVAAPEKYASRFNTGSKSVDLLYSHIYGVDQSLRRIVELLKERGEWENTILFFTSDNGATCKVGGGGGDLSLIPGNGPFRGHKGQTFQGGLRVPLLMVWPARIKQPMRVAQTVSLMDLLPTALDAAKLDVPNDLDGKSLLPLLTDPARIQHEQLFFAGIHAPAWGFSGQDVIGDAEARRDLFPGAWAVVEGDWLLRFIGTLDPGLLHTCPGGQKAHFALFNTQADPLEQYDLYATHPEVAERLTASYLHYAEMLPPPPVWDFQRWAELVPNPGKFSKTSKATKAINQE
jgi:uncharacterized sulfatase